MGISGYTSFLISREGEKTSDSEQISFEATALNVNGNEERRFDEDGFIFHWPT